MIFGEEGKYPKEPTPHDVLNQHWNAAQEMQRLLSDAAGELQRVPREQMWLGRAVALITVALRQTHLSIAGLAILGHANDCKILARAFLEGVARLFWLNKHGDEEARRFLLASYLSQRQLFKDAYKYASTPDEKTAVAEKLATLNENYKDFFTKEQLRHAHAHVTPNIKRISDSLEMPSLYLFWLRFSASSHFGASSIEEAYLKSNDGSDFTAIAFPDYAESATVLGVINMYFAGALEIFVLMFREEMHDRVLTTMRELEKAPTKGETN